jgi:hypothetical protein
MTSDAVFHGFFLSHGAFTNFDIPPGTFTLVLGINNPGDFAVALSTLMAFKRATSVLAEVSPGLRCLGL